MRWRRAPSKRDLDRLPATGTPAGQTSPARWLKVGYLLAYAAMVAATFSWLTPLSYGDGVFYILA
jgi:hypothetical protein